MIKIPAQRFAPSDPRPDLGLLADLAGSWEGHGFNLIARPDEEDGTDLYLQLNETHERLMVEPIGSVVPNRGFGQGDIEIYGMTYLDKIHDRGTDGALHIEPGIWIVQKQPTTFPPEDSTPKRQLISRMATIPHGNSVLAQGIAQEFTGKPTLSLPDGTPYNGSLFPSFNSTPFAVEPTAPEIIFNAAGSSEKGTTAAIPGAVAFPPYDMSIPAGPIASGNPGNPPFTLNTRTPFETNPPENPLPAAIDGVKIQDLVNDPIRLLQAHVQKQADDGYTFKGTVLNIATRASLKFLTKADSGPKGPTTTVNVPEFGGGIENIRFLKGEDVSLPAIPAPPPPAPPITNPPNPLPEENALTAVVYATYWIETVTHPTGYSFMQLQYAQMVVLDFPIFHLLKQNPKIYANLGWPHITVGTLRKSFG